MATNIEDEAEFTARFHEALLKIGVTDGPLKMPLTLLFLAGVEYGIELATEAGKEAIAEVFKKHGA